MRMPQLQISASHRGLTKKVVRSASRNLQKILDDKRERGKQLVADLTQRGVIKTGAALTPVKQGIASPHEEQGNLARGSPKMESTVRKHNPEVKKLNPRANNSIGNEHGVGAEQLPIPEEVPLLDLTDHSLHSRVAELISRRYRQYPLPFTAKAVENIPRSMVKPATHAEFLAHWGQAFPWDEHVTELNAQIFNNAIFRPYQREAINVVLARFNLLCCLPTGGGKSLVYQLPGLVSRGTTIVISPLLALIQDQTSQLAKKGISVRAISSQVPPSEISALYRSMSKPDFDVKFLYVTPERIAQSERFMEALQALHKNGNLRSIAVDEAHCISEWGHDFRPDYRRLSVLRQTFPEVPVIAVTGTCTPTVRDDIITQLQLGASTAVIQTSFNRPNIWLEVRPKGEDVRYEVYKYICSNNLEHQCGIVYCLTCKDAENTAEYLQKCGLKAEYYHGGLTSARRHAAQQQWMANDTHVMCTTVAFGLGIDKHDVRYVVHATMPLSIEAYYQQVGRAGRDHVLAWAVLLYRARDRLRIDHVISANNSSRLVTPTPQPRDHDDDHVISTDDVDVSYEDTVVDYNLQTAKAEKLDDMEKFCQNSTYCRRQMLLSYFGEQFSAHNCNENCDVCAHVTSLSNESRARLSSRKRFAFASQRSRKIFAKNSKQSGKEYELLDENDPQFKEKQRKIAAKGAEIAEEEELARKNREAEFKEKMRLKFEEKRQRYAARRLTRVKRAPRQDTEPVSDEVEELKPRAASRKPVRTVKLLSKDPTVIKLHEICSEIATSRGVSVARVLSDSAMKNIAKNRPKTFSELSAITGKQKAALLSSKILYLFKDD